MSKSPPLPKYTDFAALQEALAASQRECAELTSRLNLERMLAQQTMGQLQARLAAAEEVMERMAKKPRTTPDPPAGEGK